MSKLILGLILALTTASIAKISQAAETPARSRTTVSETRQAREYADSFKLGAFAGPTFSNYSLTPANPRTKTHTGFAVGAQADIPVSGVFHFQPGLRFSRRGIKLSMDGPDVAPPADPQAPQAGEASASLSLTYFEVPLLAQAKFMASDSVMPYVSLGPTLKFRMGSGLSGNDAQGRALQIDEGEIDSLLLSSFSLGIEANAGADFRITRDLGIFAQFQYDLGLSDESGVEGFELKDRNFALLTGVNFAL